MRRLAGSAALAALLIAATAADAKITAHRATPAEARAIGTAAARAGFPTSRYAETAIRVTDNGWAVSTPKARDPSRQGNGVILYHRIRGRWRKTAEGSAFGDVPAKGDPRHGIPPQTVLHALGL